MIENHLNSTFRFLEGLLVAIMCVWVVLCADFDGTTQLVLNTLSHCSKLFS